jgi:phospholipid/cholesterol/gamma-HCH transport system permease protein
LDLGGGAMTALLETVGRAAVFTWHTLISTLAAAARPREVARQFGRQLLGALPLAAVAGLALGVVVWMHLRGVLVRFGGPSAVDLLPAALTLAVVLEFGPIGAGLITAGRGGASLGAELGAMRLTEQVDALEILGLSVQRTLVGPRVLACVLVQPLLTVVINYLAIAGSFVAEAMASGTSWLHYSTACLRGLRMEDVVPHTLKTLAFGFIAGVAGCYHGLAASGGSEAVGTAATRGVVTAILGVLIADVVLVRAIHLFAPG